MDSLPGGERWESWKVNAEGYVLIVVGRGSGQGVSKFPALAGAAPFTIGLRDLRKLNRQ